MTPQELYAALSRGEDISTEFKRCGSRPERDTFETICSFANRQGGSVFLGVDDNGSILGVDAGQIREIERNIANVISNPNTFNATPSVEFERVETEQGIVLRLWIPIGPSIYRFKGEVFDRRGDADVRVRDDSQIMMMYMRKQNMYSERRIYPYIGMDDLRLDTLHLVRDLIEARNSDHPWLRLNDEEFLRSAKLYGKDRSTGAEGFTLAAAMLLGTDELISDICPAYKTDAIVRLRDTDRYDDRLIVKTNLVEAYDMLMKFAKQHLPDPFILEGDVTVSARDIICRELVSNMLIHREYANPFIAKLIIDKNGIRTENASRAMFEGEVTLSNFEPTPKNPTIADFFHQIGRADELGSGTRKLTKYSALYSGAVPYLHEGDVFVAQLQVPWNTQIGAESYDSVGKVPDSVGRVPDSVGRVPDSVGRVPDSVGKVPDKSSRQRQLVLDYLDAHEEITVAQAEVLLGVKQRRARDILNAMTRLGLVKRVGSARNTRYIAMG
ncbi:RNA-binding domain-containing protein [Bifidobacterium eulemuris]|nr:RNA-binding domain-containing protein [Bifidobacterium eulemuris]